MKTIQTGKQGFDDIMLDFIEKKKRYGLDDQNNVSSRACESNARSLKRYNGKVVPVEEFLRTSKNIETDAEIAEAFETSENLKIFLYRKNDFSLAVSVACDFLTAFNSM